MSSRIAKVLLFAAIISAFVSYLFYLNPESATIRWGWKDNQIYAGPTALILLTTFFFGIFCSGTFAFLVGLRYFIRNWKMIREERRREAQQALMVSARERLAGNRLEAARELFEKIIATKPPDILAFIHLAQTYEKQGNQSQALSVLEQARSIQSTNTELLFYAAELNRSLGNHSGAMDNLRLVLAKDPRNSLAAERLVAACCALERFDEAVVLQQQLIRNSQTNAEQKARLEKLAEIELLQLRKTFPRQDQDRRKALDEFLRRHRDYVPAIVELALLDREEGELDHANRLLLKAYKLAPDVYYLKEIAQLWLAVDEPQKSIANIRNVLTSKELSARARSEAQLFLIALLARLEWIEEALNERDRLPELPEDLLLTRRLLDSVLLRKNADYDEAFSLLLRSALGGASGAVLEILREDLDSENKQSAAWVERARTRSRLALEPAPRLLTN